MRDEKVKLVIGALLHDIGKVVYRQGDDRRKHSQSGYDYLKEKVAVITDREILDCVRYHHADAIRGASIEKDSFAYIVYMADNIASAVDRREKMQQEAGFEIHTTLQPVFNLLNGNHGEQYYQAFVLDADGAVNYPVQEKQVFDEIKYNEILQTISDNLRGVDWTEEYLNSLLEVLEANLSFVPSSTSRNEVADISLYDHLKLTAAAACCIYDYFLENGVTDYRSELYAGAKAFYGKKVFLLASLDVSGIQKFIYTIASDNALKALRSRSFYLEIMMEYIIDLLLQRLELSRANLIYAGGGHCYLLLPDTEHTKQVFAQFLREINAWYQEQFGTALYIAGGYAECSCEELHNIPAGSYGLLFRNISKMISEQKMHRYSAEEIRSLNGKKEKDYTRECKVCRRVGAVNAEGRCALCDAFEKFSGNVLQAKFFSVLCRQDENGLPLPYGASLVTDTEESLRKRMAEDDFFVQAYGKNRMYTGKHIATKLWVGDYSSGGSFQEFAKMATGINRIGVLRADVDNLGHAFVSGFDDEKNENRYATLSRTATLSRQLSLFFKLYINQILKNPQYTLCGERKEKRKAAIVYSGGDDVFIVGAWDDVIELAVDLRRSLARYTENTLTLSAGIGIYRHNYPIRAIAEEVERQESKSKRKVGKNAVTLLEDGKEHLESGNEEPLSDGTYGWEEFENEVIAEKFTVIREFFEQCDDRGKALIYRMLELIRENVEKIGFARMVYLIARLQPEKDAGDEQKELYQRFSRKMYEWLGEEDGEKKRKNCRQLKTAMEIYVYLTREEEE